MPIKREFFAKLEGISKEHVEAIMAEIGKDTEATQDVLKEKDNAIAGMKDQITGLTKQLSERDTDIAALKEQAGGSETIKQQLTDLQNKYDQDTKTLKADMDKQSLKFATEKFFGNVKFSSDLARQAAIDMFTKKEFKYENEKFLGGEDFLAELKKTQPGAFVIESDENTTTDTDDKAPLFTKGTGTDDKATKNTFDFGGGFNFIRKPPEKK